MVSPSKWIPTERTFPLPAEAKDVIARLSAAGFVVYVVGGSVRDYLLKTESKDHDLVTNATPDEVEKVFPEAIPVGKAFGVMKIPRTDERGEPRLIEVATFREDAEYHDHRHPVSVRFAGPEEDAWRRDFTINGLFYDPKTRRILDCVGGADDLRAKTLRAIGAPSERFREDALRMLRAVRFATRFEFALEPATREAIARDAKLIKKVSGERIRDELSLMWKGKHPHLAFKLLKETGLLAQILPEAQKASPKAFAALDQDPAPRAATVGWALALSEIGGEDPSKPLKGVCDRLKLSRDEAAEVIALVTDLPKFNDAFSMREATLFRWIREPYFGSLLQLHRAVALGGGGNLMAYRFCEKLWKEVQAEGPALPKLVTGEDLIQLGFRPGPAFSEILRVVEDLALERKLTTQAQALEYVVKHFVG